MVSRKTSHEPRDAWTGAAGVSITCLEHVGGVIEGEPAAPAASRSQHRVLPVRALDLERAARFVLLTRGTTAKPSASKARKAAQGAGVSERAQVVQGGRADKGGAAGGPGRWAVPHRSRGRAPKWGPSGE
jgi:hypothetical protein